MTALGMLSFQLQLSRSAELRVCDHNLAGGIPLRPESPILAGASTCLSAVIPMFSEAVGDKRLVEGELCLKPSTGSTSASATDRSLGATDLVVL
ncbi:hypothetical protein BKA70DRAFT_1303107 [Coprinopsis sp. MPI-PUGE-AT-0042]|nr:hypothetical protein BKA70DRAFT_1303107 [Coprinopsis sp. MPI-PUGE-AT-0042]